MCEMIMFNSLLCILCLLSKIIEGCGFCFDFIAKGVICSTQIINRNVAEPSLCKLHQYFALQKRWNTHEIEIPTVAFPTVILPLYWFIELRNCFDNRKTGSFMSNFMHLGKISEIICEFCDSVLFCFFQLRFKMQNLNCNILGGRRLPKT